MNEIQQAEVRHILIAHAGKYPRMTPCDGVKLLYQNEFGGGHLIRDREQAMARLRAEYAATPHDPSLPLFEDIGNGLVRVMLGAVNTAEYPLESLMDDFIRSAALRTGNKDTFLKKLDILRELSERDAFPFTAGELDAYLELYIAAGCPMVSHSEQYRAAYHPAYRVILRPESSPAPFLETERLILRKFREEDFADFHAYANDPEMCRMMGRDDMSDPESARFTFNWLKDREERGYAILLKETGQVIGNLTVSLPPPFVAELREVNGKKGRSMSFSLSRRYQRQGLMEEALRSVIPRLFEEGTDYINLGHFDFNLPSRELQKKLGFTYLTTYRFEQDGEKFVTIENILWRD